MIYGFDEFTTSEVCPCCGEVLWYELGYHDEDEYHQASNLCLFIYGWAIYAYPFVCRDDDVEEINEVIDDV